MKKLKTKKTKKKKVVKGGRASGASKTKAKKIPKGPKSVGAVTHYFKKIKVAVIKLKKPVNLGEKGRIKGATTDFIQALESMQFDHKPIVKALPGRQVGARVKSRVRDGDLVFIEKE